MSRQRAPTDARGFSTRIPARGRKPPTPTNAVDRWGRVLACPVCGRPVPRVPNGRPHTSCGRKAGLATLGQRQGRWARVNLPSPPHCSACGEQLSVPHRRACPIGSVVIFERVAH